MRNPPKTTGPRPSALLKADEIANDLIRGAEARAAEIVKEAEKRAAALQSHQQTQARIDVGFAEDGAQRVRIKLPESFSTPASASGFLDEASRIVAGARNTTHGDKERSFKAIADMLNTYMRNRKGRELEAEIDEVDVANMWVLVKMARSLQGTPVRDHYVDMAGYAGIAGELATTSGRVKT